MFTARLMLASLLLALAACGSPGPGDALPDAGLPVAGLPGPGDGLAPDSGTPPSPFVPGPHGPLPLIKSLGGTVLTQPALTAITFEHSALATTFEHLVRDLPGTTYWKGLRDAYGVGEPTVTSPVLLTNNLPNPVTTEYLKTWLAQGIEAGTLPSSTREGLYVLLVPRGLTVTAGGSTLCKDLDGWHWAGYTSKAYFAFAAIGQCDDVDPPRSMELITTHELVEAATDPYPNADATWAVKPAYYTWNMVDAAFFLFTAEGVVAEVADACHFSAPGGDLQLPDFPYAVERYWSNQAAQAGHDPCQPSTGEPYFNSVPVLERLTLTSPNGASEDVNAIKVPAGTSRTVPVQLFSDAPTAGPWQVTAVDLSKTPGALTLSFDRAWGQNGDELKLTVKVNQAGQGGVQLFAVRSVLGSRVQVWPVIIVN